MWQGSRPSPDRTHHVKNGAPLYAARFEVVLPFHEPGLAPVRRGKLWFHIQENGEPACGFRFDRAFGFYEGLAAVVKDGTSYHILPTGEPAYSTRFAWCGNFQEGRCSVRDSEGRYLHIHPDGTPAYVDRYAYVGDFREGAAVVFGADGMAWHIDVEGRPLNGTRFMDLGPFHKGIATAKDAEGWFHVNREGRPLYEERYSVLEQFYNGVAWAEASGGVRVLIDEEGMAREAGRGPLPTLTCASADMTAYWRSQVVCTAFRSGVLQRLPSHVPPLAHALGWSPSRTLTFLEALEELGYVRHGKGGEWSLSRLGVPLVAGHGDGLASVAYHWSVQTVSKWEGLETWLKGDPSPLEEHEPDFFAKLGQSPVDVLHLQRMLEMYATDDYAGIGDGIHLGDCDRVIDAAGGTGTLLRALLVTHPHIQAVLLERHEVVDLLEKVPPSTVSFEVIPVDLFQRWPIQGDVVFLAKLIHDWNDDLVVQILERAKEALNPGGQVYVVERIRRPSSASLGLLSLHLNLMNGGRERTFSEMVQLFLRAGLSCKRSFALQSGFEVLMARPM